MRIITKRGYDFGEVSSAMQKAIRRADTRLAGYALLRRAFAILRIRVSAKAGEILRPVVKGISAALYAEREHRLEAAEPVMSSKRRNPAVVEATKAVDYCDRLVHQVHTACAGEGSRLSPLQLADVLIGGADYLTPEAGQWRRNEVLQPHRLRDEPDIALEREPFAPRIASHRSAAARQRARLKPIEPGHSGRGTLHPTWGGRGSSDIKRLGERCHETNPDTGILWKRTTVCQRAGLASDSRCGAPPMSASNCVGAGAKERE